MPRKPEIDRPVRQMLALPESIWAWLHLHLHSDIEGRIPQGKISQFFISRIREYRENQYLDLAPYIPGLETGAFTVRGSDEAIRRLKMRLEGGG